MWSMLPTGVLFSQKKEKKVPDTCYTMDETWKHIHTKWKTQRSQINMIPSTRNVQRRQIHGDRLKEGGKGWLPIDTRLLLGSNENILEFGHGAGYTTLWIHYKWSVCLKGVNFTYANYTSIKKIITVVVQVEGTTYPLIITTNGYHLVCTGQLIIYTWFCYNSTK